MTRPRWYTARVNALATHDMPPSAIPSQLYLISASDGAALLELLTPQLLQQLQRRHIGVVVPLRNLTPALAEVLRLLAQASLPVVGRLSALNPPSDWFHVRNYPQALERFQQVHSWLSREQLQLHAVALQVEPPADTLVAAQGLSSRVLARHLWLAHENVLYSAAGAAMVELCAEIHLAGMEVHSLQVPLVIDDRWAGTTLLQRAFDLIPVPADVEIILCQSNLIRQDTDARFATAVAALYCDDVDALALEWPGPPPSGPAPLPPALQRQLQYAAAGADVVYLAGFERIVAADQLDELLHILAGGDRPPLSRLVLQLRLLRSALRGVLVLTRLWRPLLAWTGWLLALGLYLRNRKRSVGNRS